jgi:hypothetical protein
VLVKKTLKNPSQALRDACEKNFVPVQSGVK